MFFYPINALNSNKKYTYNTKIFSQKAPKFFICWIIIIPFLAFELWITSLTKHYIFWFITSEGFLLTISGIGLAFFGIPSFFNSSNKRRKNIPTIYFPIQYKELGNFLTIFFLIICLIAIFFLWIPDLPPVLQTNLRASWGVPTLTFIFDIIKANLMAFSFCFFNVETTIIVDYEQKMVTIKGKTLHYTKFYHQLPLTDQVKIIFQPIQARRPRHVTINKLRWITWLDYEEKIYVIYVGTYEQILSYATDLANTGWSSSMKNTLTLEGINRLQLYIHH